MSLSPLQLQMVRSRAWVFVTKCVRLLDSDNWTNRRHPNLSGLTALPGFSSYEHFSSSISSVVLKVIQWSSVLSLLSKCSSYFSFDITLPAWSCPATDNRCRFIHWWNPLDFTHTGGEFRVRSIVWDFFHDPQSGMFSPVIKNHPLLFAL